MVFIGEPGSGKTTTICNFLKLTIDAEVGDQFDRVELFETAQGRTTAAEVHFQRADRTAMVVYPMDISQQKAIVKEYCSYIWHEVFPDENEGDEQDEDTNEDNSPDTSIEIETIICNMLGYESDDDFLDYVLEEYSGDGLDEFIDETLEKLSINSQIPIEFTYDGSDDVKKWLQSTFTGINKVYPKPWTEFCNHGQIK